MIKKDVANLALIAALSFEASAHNPKPTIPVDPEPQKAKVTLVQPTPTENNLQKEGSFVKDMYKSELLNKEIPVNVYLPPNYDTDIKYSVLYLLHGKPFDQTHWKGLGVMSTNPNFIMVMPQVPEPLFSGTDGGKGSYETEMLESLMPYIESHYSVNQSPSSRAIAGISRGGIWSLEIGLSHPELFGTVISLSPALAVNEPRVQHDPFNIAKQSKVGQDIMLIAGNADWARFDTIRLSNTLSQQGIKGNLKIIPGKHEAKTWESAVPEMLKFVDHNTTP